MNTLTLEQREVFDSVINGDNVFCSGIAGCGKSYLIQVIYDEIPKRKRGGSGLPYRIQKTALTGCAAILLGQGSKTIHSWSGVGIARDSAEELAKRVKKNTKAKKNWLCTDLLIIDEISMMTCELLEKLDKVGQIIRNCRKPFGGIQLLLVGDFCQLPPVVKEYGGADKPVFAFESSQWSTIVSRVYHLQSIQRQQDEDFQRVLVEARNGSLSAQSIAILKSRQGLSWRKMKIKPTLLFPRKADVDYVNESNLDVLKDDKRKFIASVDTPPGFNTKDPWFMKAIETMDAEANYSNELILCLKAQVMLIHNLNTEIALVNGSRGVVVGFEQSGSGNPIVEFMNGCKMPIAPHQWEVEGYKDVYRKQIPLRLAWAITIHKAQGATLDCALIDIGTNTFEFGQAYVALSRVRSLESLYIHDFADDSIRCHPKVKKFYAKFQPSLYNIMSQQGVTKVIEESDEESEVGVIEEESSTNWLYADLTDDWKAVLKEKEALLGTLSDMLNGKNYLPHREDIWNALHLCPLKDVRVVILGQDPYPTPGNAHGLAFSIRPDVKVLPGSLRNIYKELEADVGAGEPANGSLIPWAKQGILLLNTVLTVEPGKPQSHAGQGWEEITDAIIQTVYKKNPNVIFVFWGKSAQVKKKLIGGCKNIIEAPHPSPLSARTGFFGSKPFSKINTILGELGQQEIKWS
jgi:ATP-dependent DNA helicase PIF1